MLVDPCKLTALDSQWEIDPVDAILNSEAMNVVIPDISDESSSLFGKKDSFALCGTRKYEIVTQAAIYDNFMSFDEEKTLTIAATRDADLGSHFITIRASLADYPQVNSMDTVLLIRVETCKVNTISFI